MKYHPPFHPDPNYVSYDNFTENLAEDLTIRYWSQGGTNPTRIEPHMVETHQRVCEAIHEDCDKLWDKAWEAMKKK